MKQKEKFNSANVETTPVQPKLFSAMKLLSPDSHAALQSMMRDVYPKDGVGSKFGEARDALIGGNVETAIKACQNAIEIIAGGVNHNKSTLNLHVMYATQMDDNFNRASNSYQCEFLYAHSVQNLAQAFISDLDGNSLGCKICLSYAKSDLHKVLFVMNDMPDVLTSPLSSFAIDIKTCESQISALNELVGLLN